MVTRGCVRGVEEMVARGCREEMVTRGCVRGVVQLVALVDAAGIHNKVILHEGEIASLRRFKNVGLAGDASCSSSLQTNVSWREGMGSLGRTKWMCACIAYLF
jgi:hypothetical protein